MADFDHAPAVDVVSTMAPLEGGDLSGGVCGRGRPTTRPASALPRAAGLHPGAARPLKLGGNESIDPARTPPDRPPTACAIRHDANPAVSCEGPPPDPASGLAGVRRRGGWRGGCGW